MSCRKNWRNRHVVDDRELTDAQIAWFHRTVKTQGCVLAEPWRSRVFDFSVHFDLAPDGQLRRKGFVHLDNTPRGQFRSCSVTPRFTDGMSTELRRFLHEPSPTKRRSWLDTFIDDTLAPALAGHFSAVGYHGPLGIDAFFYRDADATLKLRPVSEINPRYTMGRVALELAKTTPQNATTTFSIHPVNTALPADAIPLTDPSTARRYLAALSVGQ